jgi:hypothetical protein
LLGSRPATEQKGRTRKGAAFFLHLEHLAKNRQLLRVRNRFDSLVGAMSGEYAPNLVFV